MEDIVTRTRSDKACTRSPMKSKIVPKTSREDIRPERPIFKLHKCDSTSHLANTCTKKTKINESLVIEEAHSAEEKGESDKDSSIYEDTPEEDYPIEKINVLDIYKNAFDSAYEPLGAIRRHEVDITLNVERPYPPVLRRPADPESPRPREALEKHIQELIQLGVIRNVGHSEEVEVTTPVIIAWHNDKSKMVEVFRGLNT
ncbi:hypothetical protein O181_012288 [Austropuccinia psidii MF-1]|uniref:Uncharacterized protein n=1 Tax=Austropuccinia psidii MF-1 TaxID=1389203 RepID=A0A9Q3BX03_9BASI|nr:hypothetical protein [Austropuccinia psidii MF-1]